MKILETELEFDFNDADDMEKLENAVEKTTDKINAMQDEVNKNEAYKTSKAIRECCQAVFDCFNSVWGAGTAQKVFGNKTNMKTCIEAFKAIADARIQQDNEFSEELTNIEKEYGTNRGKRKNPKKE